MVSASTWTVSVAFIAVCALPQVYCYEVCSQSGSIIFYCSGLFRCCGETACCTTYWLWVLAIGAPIAVCIGIALCICRYRRRQRLIQRTTVIRSSYPNPVVVGHVSTVSHTYQGQQAYPEPTAYSYEKVPAKPPPYHGTA
ncbi:uncharacterized protein [Ptychodera flava]|uniref:uncharacterized protein n=1 Tax=Ptychodera flava TaxID=63121 RepID=UPI00396A7BDA